MALQWDTIIDCFSFKTHQSQTSAEIRYHEPFEKAFLTFLVKIVNFAEKDFDYDILTEYMNSGGAFRLLKAITDYLRKELKVPTYSDTFADEAEF